MTRLKVLSVFALTLLFAPPLGAQSGAAGGQPAAPLPTYADLATLADGAPLVVRAEIRRQTTIPAERAATLAPGHARLLVEARTGALIAGTTPLGEGLRYLVDVPLDARGKVPKLRKRQVLLFARTVPGRPGELQLVAPAAQLDWSPALEAALRPILAELAAHDAPRRVTGVRDALAVPGNLAGESESQIFLTTEAGAPASLTVLRRPGMAPSWGVSWGEIVDQAAGAPARGTLGWYRLACSLPPRLPAAANLAGDAAARGLAERDFALVIDQLGPCERTLPVR